MCLEIEPKAWADAGIFFARSVFGVLGSYLLVSKMREWCVPVDTGKIKALVEEIETEIRAVEAKMPSKEADPGLISIKNHYDVSKKEAKDALEKSKSWDKGIVIVTYVVVLLCALVDVYLICSGLCKEWGCCSLLLLAPLPIALRVSKCRNRKVEEDSQQIRNEFQKKKNDYQKAYKEAKEETGAADILEQYQASQIPHRPPFPQGPGQQ